MRKVMFLCCAVALLGMVLAGCEEKSEATAPATLCSKCGQIKDTTQCCAVDAVKCASCGLTKGSPACCKGIDFSKGDVQLRAQCVIKDGLAKCPLGNTAK